MAVALDAGGRYLYNLEVLQLYAVFGLGVQFYEYSALATVGGEGETFYAAAGCGGEFGFDAVVGEVYGIVSDSGLFGAFVNARAVSLVGLLFVAHAYFQFAVGGHYAQAAEGPFVYVAEAAYVFE